MKRRDYLGISRDVIFYFFFIGMTVGLLSARTLWYWVPGIISDIVQLKYFYRAKDYRTIRQRWIILAVESCGLLLFVTTNKTIADLISQWLQFFVKYI